MEPVDHGYFLLGTRCEGILAHVFLNGAEVYRTLDPTPTAMDAKVNHWVVEGANRVRVFLAPVPWERIPGATRRSPDFVLELKHNKVIKDEHVTRSLVSFHHQEEEAPLAYTLVLDREVHVEEAFGRWAWQGAYTFDETSVRAEAGALRALAAAVHAGFARCDIAALLALQRGRNEDLGRALGVTLGKIESTLREGYANLFALSGWSLDPLDSDTLTLELQPNRRLVAVKDARGRPPITGRAQGEGLSFPMMAAKLDGAWTIVR